MVVDAKTRRTHGSEPWFIKFYAPWCGACKRTAPIWNELADKRGKELKVAKLDCTQADGSDLCTNYDVEGYPTLLYIKDSKMYKFRGQRTLEALEEFALNKGYLNAEEILDIPQKVVGWELKKK